jgi:secondary thiamine-phosphate synthase enzyme
MAVSGGMLRVETAGDSQVVDLTEGVRSIVRTSGVERGVAIVFARGATVGVTTMEYEPGGVEDLTELLEQLAPRARAWAHNRLNGDTNAHAHLRAALVGPSESVPLIEGELQLGTWQQIVLLDFDDRPRRREITVQVLS